MYILLYYIILQFYKEKMNREMGKEYEQILHKENKNGKNLLENHLTSLVLRKVQITIM